MVAMAKARIFMVSYNDFLIFHIYTIHTETHQRWAPFKNNNTLFYSGGHLFILYSIYHIYMYFVYNKIVI